jgi:O-antigen/teichoic acid export membrane protein
VSEQAGSYRRILKTSSIIGGASVINILIGLVRTKALAALIGPSGVGLVSLYTSMVTTATVVSTMGIGTIGTREVASAIGQDDQRALAVVRRAMFWGSMLLALLGGFAVWSLRDVIAQHMLGNTTHAPILAWLAAAVAFSVIGTSQGALIQGMQRIGDMARLSVYGAVLNTVFGIFLLWLYGSDGLVAYMLVGPLTSFLLGQWYVTRLPSPVHARVPPQELLDKWKLLIRLGLPFMGAALVSSAVQLWIRVEVGDTLGVDALGHFQAASSISMQYIGFVLAAMGADYYPRLSTVIDNPQAATRLVNEQTEIALLLSAPIFMAMLSFTPWVIELLYSSEFRPAEQVLQWQILGDVLKVASWPLGFVIVAAGAGSTFFWTETLVLLLMGGVVAWLTPRFGLQITGVAFLMTYVVYLPIVYILAKRRIGFQWSPMVKRLVTVISLLAVGIVVTANRLSWGPLAGGLCSAAFGLYTLLRIARMSAIGLPAGRVIALAQRIVRMVK